MKIAYVTPYDARQVRSWSGLGYHIAAALEDRGVRLHHCGPLRYPKHPVNVGLHLANRFLLRRNDHAHRSPGFVRSLGRQAGALVAPDDDVVFGPGGLPLIHLETDKPFAIYTDCTFASLRDYYPAFSNLSARTRRDGEAAEQALYNRLDHAFFACRWAADSAVRDYAFDPQKITVVPFGANLPELYTAEEIDRFVDARPVDRCRLLFIGVDWYRKGGDVALDAARRLNNAGLPTTLQVVGVDPPASVRDPFVEPLGFIKKSDPAGIKRLGELLTRATFLIVPSRAEAFGLVFAEAASCGLPSLAPRTGGIPDALEDGVSGHLFDADADGEPYAERVRALLAEPDRYRERCREARRHYERRLNWRVAGTALADGLRRLAAAPSPAPAGTV